MNGKGRLVLQDIVKTYRPAAAFSAVVTVVYAVGGVDITSNL